jgi:hypothetical protein
MPPARVIAPTIVLKDTGTPKGRGAFALSAHAENSIVEICPVVIFDVPDPDLLPKEIGRRIFKWSTLIGKQGMQRGLALGYGSMYNHANPANLRYCASRITQTMTFIANRQICVGDELTINYDEPSGLDSSSESAWMKREGIEPSS